MANDKILTLIFPVRGGEALPNNAVRIDGLFEHIVLVVDKRHAAGHTCAKIVSHSAEDNDQVWEDGSAEEDIENADDEASEPSPGEE